MIVYGVVHLKSLPGSPGNYLTLDEIIELAQEDVNSLVFGGVDGLIIENFGDVPFTKDNVSKRTIASFTKVVENIEYDREIKVGINVLRNDGIAALSIAEATNADFVRINVLNNVMMYTDQGIIEGKAHEIAEFKNTLNKEIDIYADVFVKHAVPPEGSKIENHTEELIERAGADVVIVTGDGTGHQINIEDLSKVRDIVPQGRLAIGSGVNEENVDDYVGLADILIVGTSFKLEQDVSKRVDQRSVEQLIQKIK
ncbi:MAG: BtpA/SgcQ family protein [Candidatus Actinomarinales bacterium]|nr:MAG: BtpA/SgcQ family protein [Candidatus Actinomarinales bacterium]